MPAGTSWEYQANEGDRSSRRSCYERDASPKMTASFSQPASTRLQIIRRVASLRRYAANGNILRPSSSWWSVCLVCIPIGLASCTDGPTFCARPSFPGLIVEVRDHLGRPAALGTKLYVSDGEFTDSAVGQSNALTIEIADNRAGLYDMRIIRPWYRETTIRSVRVPGDRCGAIEPVDVPVTLSLAAGAPAVRNVVVLPPRAEFDTEGVEITYHAHVDADPGESLAVSWSSSDTSVAAVSETGVAVSRCSTLWTEVVITATSLADTTKYGVGYMTVHANASTCP